MKKSYMNINNLLSEGFFKNITKFLRKKPKLDTKTKKKILSIGLNREINDLNNSVSSLEDIIKKHMGDNYPDLPRFDTSDFL